MMDKYLKPFDNFFQIFPSPYYNFFHKQTSAIMKANIAKFLNRLTTFKLSHITPGLKTITYKQAIHLSHVIKTDIPIWPNDPPVEFENVAELDKDGYYLRRFSIGEHSATHINAPNSFHPGSIGIDQYSAESLIIPAIVINISNKVIDNYDYILSINDLKDWEKLYGKIPKDSIVLISTGWENKWEDKQAFFNIDKLGEMHFPGIGKDATEFLLQHRHIAGIGIDTHGIDAAQDKTFISNYLVLEKPRIVLENLTNLSQLPPKGTTLIIGILRLENGSGSPVGVIALVS